MFKVVKINAQGFLKVADLDFAPPNHVGNFQKNFVAVFQILPLYPSRASFLDGPP